MSLLERKDPLEWELVEIKPHAPPRAPLYDVRRILSSTGNKIVLPSTADVTDFTRRSVMSAILVARTARTLIPATSDEHISQ